jgi:hypothetical protein
MFDRITRTRGLASVATVTLLAVVMTGCSSAGAATAQMTVETRNSLAHASEAASLQRDVARMPFGSSTAAGLAEAASLQRDVARMPFGRTTAAGLAEAASLQRDVARMPFGSTTAALDEAASLQRDVARMPFGSSIQTGSASAK